MKVPEIHQPGHLFAPLWQVSPADYGVVNVNLLSDPRISELYHSMLKAETGVLSSNFEVGDMVRAPISSSCLSPFFAGDGLFTLMVP